MKESRNDLNDEGTEHCVMQCSDKSSVIMSGSNDVAVPTFFVGIITREQ